jgi:alkanesulfonate monooxygenase SsuD/methylene tetrahydromethanopterin reductase-like flavin-dependent oxidoreductase (luciferase family)
MRIGLFAGTTPDTSFGLAELVAFARDLEARGFDTLWLPNIFGLDAVGACAIAGWETDRIELGTAVTPTYPRHPAALAQQAMTTQAA